MSVRLFAKALRRLVEKISAAVRDVTKLRADIALVEVGSLPNDGKVIEDVRSYQ